jgi:hypothetical protein
MKNEPWEVEPKGPHVTYLLRFNEMRAGKIISPLGGNPNSVHCHHYKPITFPTRGYIADDSGAGIYGLRSGKLNKLFGMVMADVLASPRDIIWQAFAAFSDEIEQDPEWDFDKDIVRVRRGFIICSGALLEARRVIYDRLQKKELERLNQEYLMRARANPLRGVANGN